jgi:hypothetical protein
VKLKNEPLEIDEGFVVGGTRPDSFTFILANKREE